MAAVHGQRRKRNRGNARPRRKERYDDKLKRTVTERMCCQSSHQVEKNL